MKVHWKVTQRFGMAPGKHSKKRKTKNMSFHVCKSVSNLKLKVRKSNMNRRKSLKRNLPSLLPIITTQYRCKKLDSLKLVIKRIRNINVNGYRLINLGCLEKNMNDIMKHIIVCDAAKICVTEDRPVVRLVSELKTHGLASVLCICCTGCNTSFKFETSPRLDNIDSKHSNYDINVRAVWGSVVTGNGASHLKEVMATMDAPSLSQPAFTKIESQIGAWWEFMSQDEVLAAGAEERRLAIENNSFHQGVPAITVIADGGWSKRTHKHSYNGLGGVAIIIGQRTGKIIFIGIRNKYCYICSHAKNSHQEVKPHQCYKNWNSNSQAMEADIILEGFSLAEKLHGLRYMWLVGDGDSSVYARIHEEIPVWGCEVSKLECSNHVCKCLRSNLEKLVESNPHYKGKNNLTKAVRIRLVSAVRCAIRIRSKDGNKNQAATQLDKDIRNSVHHIFGNHEKCSDFCKANSTSNLSTTSTTGNSDTLENDEPSDLCIQTNLLWKEGTSLKDQELSRFSTTLSYCDLKSDMLNDISVLLDRVASKSKRLINNTTTNLAECWMHMRTKFDGGKVYNLCNRGSWHTRCYGGCLRMNVGAQWSPTVWKEVTGSSPGHHFVKLYKERDTQLTLSNISKAQPQAQANRWKRKVSSAQESSSKSAKKSYGTHAIQCEDDVSESVLLNKIDRYMSNHINISVDRLAAITTITADQSNSQVWHQERKKRITASNFGLILKRKPKIPVIKIVEQLLYKTFKGNEYTLFGLHQERNTIHEYVLKKAEEGTNVTVESCGLVIHQEHKFLGGSPDGLVLINNNRSGLIEIKNVLKNKKMNLFQAAKTNRNFFLFMENNKLKLKTNHNYFYQCQGLLHICDLPWIDFVVRTTDPYQLHIERIYKEHSIWESWLLKLRAFYVKVLVPELACPRHGKIPGIREPGVWFEDTTKSLCVGKKSVRPCKKTPTSVRPCKKTTTSVRPCKKTTPFRSKSPVTASTSTETVSTDRTTGRRAASTKTKFLGRQIKHRWKLSEDSDNTEWYTGSVTSLLSGVDGSLKAVYEVLYDNDDEAYAIDHLVEDFKEGSVQFLDL